MPLFLHAASPLSVLVIEDSAVCALLIERMLETSFATTTLARSLAAGLQQLDTEYLDVVLLDLTLPDSMGLDTLVRVRNFARRIPIVVLTGTDDLDKAINALRLGAQEYMLKDDVTPRRLKRTIASACERSRISLIELERIRLYEQREDFIATLTHDLKNPIIGTNRILDLMTEQRLGSLTKQQTEILLAIKDSNSALLDMVANFLEAHRHERDMQSLHLETLDLRDLITKHITNIKPLLDDREISLQTDFAPGLEPVLVDQCSMRRMVDNLVGNAIKFVPDGGIIGIKLWQEKNERVLFQVSDTGPGIPAEEREHLFQRFWRSHRHLDNLQSTGLGLYVCQQIVRAHNGEIWCEPEDRQGATFTVSLPLAS